MKCSDTNSVTICSAIFGENIEDNFSLNNFLKYAPRNVILQQKKVLFDWAKKKACERKRKKVRKWPLQNLKGQIN